MKTRILFRLTDRTEHSFEVEGTGQNEWYQAGYAKLCELNTPTIQIESWQTFADIGEPGCDKTDGVSIRSALQKVRFDLLPWASLTLVAKVMTFGAYHYGDHNWEAGFSWSRCIGSAMRHFVKWVMREENDDESGLPHLAHAIANLLFLLEYSLHHTGTDDRPTDITPEAVTEFFTPYDANIRKGE